MEMDERKIKILQAIINDYINTAEPVGSRTIAKKYNLGVSSATIRNEMADLEEMGYLEHLHTSSGRKPSDKGYRLYVDKLMQVPTLSLEEELLIKSQILNAALYEIDKVIKQATQLLSELTKLTCIVKAPSAKKSFIKSIQLINVDSTSILAVIITDTNLIKNTIIRVRKPVSTDILLKLNNLLNAKLKNLTIEQINLSVINSIKNDLINHEEIFDAIIPALYDSLNSAETSEVYLEGTTNIFNYPEYNDIEKAREFLYLLNNKENLQRLLNTNNSISISIGEENYLEGAKDCSVVSGVYSLGGRPLGAIGVIGPTRIPYSKIVSLLTKIMKEINDTLNQTYLENK
ncbi:heat-inducible transcriptional repressor HrcA [Clostridium sp. SYSU_GA19001]|uniref:heat-inducible transcriptional repressor HrcA n=1 Tax=Clostridium caldaquaticum TaxID=2940653 RepID=UPI0020774DD8|nr:heat-inducible transcriptional repressor HrcA [Clostridium caldaquaticum]MCM8710400.1 heat-inducible transcriptional repressor HrcA [Clostridium caldaquaticum]